MGPQGFVTYICYGLETSATGTPHLQGYLECSRPVSLTAIRGIQALQRSHFEPRRGTQDQAITYCRKDSDFHEAGIRKKQGRRSDLDAVAQCISEATDLATVAATHPVEWIKYARGIRDLDFTLRAAKASSCARDVSNRLYWGVSDSGKTYSVYEEFGYSNVFKLDNSPSGVWFDGYRSQPVLLIDDFYGWIPYGHLLNILDAYPLRCSTKGGHTWAMWTTVIITSNGDPRRWYQDFILKRGLTINDDGLTPALARRITTIRRFTESRT